MNNYKTNRKFNVSKGDRIAPICCTTNSKFPFL